MENTKKIIKIDLISIYPYLTIKNLLLILLITGIYFFISNNSFILFLIPLLSSMMFSSYPFLVGEDSGIDALYSIYSIDRRDVVRGRYIFPIILFIACTIIGIILLSIGAIFKGIKVFDGMLEFYISYIFFYLFVISFQYPFYFKYGYKKAKSFAILPFLVMGILVFASSYNKDLFINLLKFASENILFTLIGAFLFLFLIVFISIKLSIKFYKRRDL